MDENRFTDSLEDHLDPFDLGYSDGTKRIYKNPFDENTSAYFRYDLGFDSGLNSK